MHNLQFRGTWADLLAGLQTLTAEQLARPVFAAHEERIHHDVSLEITQEAQYYQDGDFQGGQTEYDQWTVEEREGMKREEPGEVYLFLHD